MELHLTFLIICLWRMGLQVMKLLLGISTVGWLLLLFHLLSYKRAKITSNILCLREVYEHWNTLLELSFGPIVSNNNELRTGILITSKHSPQWWLVSRSSFGIFQLSWKLTWIVAQVMFKCCSIAALELCKTCHLTTWINVYVNVVHKVQEKVVLFKPSGFEIIGGGRWKSQSPA
jgi:hypothetical protein